MITAGRTILLGKVLGNVIIHKLQGEKKQVKPDIIRYTQGMYTEFAKLKSSPKGRLVLNMSRINSNSTY